MTDWAVRGRTGRCEDAPEGARTHPGGQMPEEWEVLTLRGLAATDERAEEFVGTTVGRLLSRSVGFRRSERT